MPKKKKRGFPDANKLVEQIAGISERCVYVQKLYMIIWLKCGYPIHYWNWTML